MPIDKETRLNESSSDALKLWLRLNACNNQILGIVRDTIRQQFAMTLPRFELMAHLADHKSGLKMKELSERLMVSNGNITTITAQLEKEGFIEKLQNKEDHRSTYIRLTTKGTRLHNKMTQAYEQCLEEVFANFSNTQHKTLYNALSKLKEELNKP